MAVANLAQWLFQVDNVIDRFTGTIKNCTNIYYYNYNGFNLVAKKEKKKRKSCIDMKVGEGGLELLVFNNALIK